MSTTTTRSLLDYIRLLHDRRDWILRTTAVCTALGLLMAVMHRRDWQASQAMLVRDVAIANIAVPGRFLDADSRKAAQETVVELAHSPTVISAALKKVGPQRQAWGEWPSQEDVETTMNAIDMRAPDGAEFGSTELFYLLVKDSDRERAIELTRSLGEELESHLQDLRQQKAQSTVSEVAKSVRLAEESLTKSTQELTEFESRVGRDIVELKSLTGTGVDSNLQRQLSDIKNELRQASRQHDTNLQLLEILKTTSHQPERLLGTPNELLESQPTLRRLKDGLVDAQLLTARLSGALTSIHPSVKAARAAEAEIRLDVARELTSAVRGLEAAIEISHRRVGSLDDQRQSIEQRLAAIVPLRADYQNLLDEVQHRGEILQTSERNLADALADQEAAQTASLITRWGEPLTGSSPIGMGRMSILILGFLGGIALGIGLVVAGTPQWWQSLTAAEEIPALVRSLHVDWRERPRVSTLRDALSHVLTRTTSVN